MTEALLNSCRASLSRTTVLFGLLLALNIGFDLVLCPVSKPFPDDRLTLALTMAAGATTFLAQLVLLAFWTALGCQPLARRLPQALLVLAAIWFAVTWSSTQYKGQVEPQSARNVAEVLSVLFVALQLPLWLARWLGRWRIDRALRIDDANERQFGLRRLFAWTALTAFILAAARFWVGPELADDAGGRSASVAETAVMSLLCVGLAIPIYLTAWAVLLAGRRPKTRGALIAGAIAPVAAGVAALYLNKMLDEAAQLAGGEAGALVALAFNLAVVRACGYQLVRRPGGARIGDLQASARTLDGESEQARSPAQPIPIHRSGWFACWTLCMLVAAGILAWTGVRAEFGRRRQIEMQAWRDRGFTAYYQNGRLTSMRYAGKQPPTDEHLESLAALKDLETLNLTDVHLLAGQLARLSKLENVAALDLSGANVTDADLAELKHLRRLKYLSLRRTQASPAAIEQLRAALPDCKIVP